MAKQMDDRLYIRFDKATKDAIEAHAESLGLNASSWVRMVVTKELKTCGAAARDGKAA